MVYEEEDTCYMSTSRALLTCDSFYMSYEGEDTWYMRRRILSYEYVAHLRLIFSPSTSFAAFQKPKP
jgi:hypothetical protein